MSTKKTPTPITKKKRVWRQKTKGPPIDSITKVYPICDYADLQGADLRGCVLTRVDLRNANLSSALLAGADLTDAWMSEANLRGATLTRANLTCTDLSSANLSGADLEGASFRDAKLSVQVFDSDKVWRVGWPEGYTVTLTPKGSTSCNDQQ